MGALLGPFYPVTRRRREWWEPHTLLGASPEMRAAQAAQFEREAQIMFKRAALALGRVEAEAMWRNIAKKKPGKPRGKRHSPEFDAQMLAHYDQCIISNGRKSGALAETVRRFQPERSQSQPASVKRRLQHLLAERKRKRLREMAERRFIYPTLMGGYSPKGDE